MSNTVTCPHCNIQYTLEEYGSHWCYGYGLAPSNTARPIPQQPIIAKDTQDIIDGIVDEFHKALRAFPPFHSAHEGYAILYEEVCELWEVVREKQSTSGREDRLKKECIQVAAMAMRFLHDMKGFKN